MFKKTEWIVTLARRDDDGEVDPNTKRIIKLTFEGCCTHTILRVMAEFYLAEAEDGWNPHDLKTNVEV